MVRIIAGRVVAAVLPASVLVASALAQTPDTKPAPQNPNVPAVTGDRQAVPMGGTHRPDIADSTRGSATGHVKVEQRPRLLELAQKHREGAIKLQTDLQIGTVLPSNATLIDIPSEFGLDRYKLVLANQKTLLVDPSTRRVEEVID